MTVREALSFGREFFCRKRFEVSQAEHETRLILAHLLKTRPLDLYLHLEAEVPQEIYFSLLEERARGKPLAYVLGETEFWGRTFNVRPGVLIPRPETEILVEAFLEDGPSEGTILELGVGSGVVIITCLLERPTLKGVGLDVSPKALKITVENAEKHGVKSRLFLVRGDWLSTIRPGAGFSAIVSNPPYVSAEDFSRLSPEIREHEPREALWGGFEGLDFIRRSLKEAPLYLVPGGKIFLEIGYNQRQAVEDLAEHFGYKVYFKKDLSGLDRVAVMEP